MPKRYVSEMKLWLNTEERVALQDAADERGLTMSDLVRHAVNDYCHGQILIPRRKKES